MDYNKKKDQFACPYASMGSCFPPPAHNEVVNLMDLWDVIWKRRFLISIVAISIVGMVWVYTFSIPQTYVSKVTIRRPSDLGIGGFVAGISPYIPGAEKQFSPESVFRNVLNTIQDKAVQAQFWDDSEMVRRLTEGKKNLSVNISKSWFVQNIVVNIPHLEKEVKQASISLSGENPDVIPEVLNSFILYARDYSGFIVLENMKEKLAEKKNVIENQIKLARNSHNVRIEKRIAELIEHKTIAEKIKIIDMPENMAAKPEYAKGVKALQAEIDLFKERKNNDLWITGVPILFIKLKALNEIDFTGLDISSLQAHPASAAVQLTKPKQKFFIVAIGGVAGLIFSVFLAFLMDFLKNVKIKKS